MSQDKVIVMDADGLEEAVYKAVINYMKTLEGSKLKSLRNLAESSAKK